jgi:uncharacterized iron-regulated membrane protein
LRFRRFLLSLHQWVGLVAALFLIVIALSGSALVFEAEIDRALNAPLYYVTPGDRALPLETLLARVRAAVPKDQVTGLHIAEKPGLAYEVSLESGLWALVDPYTGAVLGVRDRDVSLARRLHVLHTTLLANDFGERVVGWLCVALLILALSGVYLWWPRKIVSLRRASSWKRANFDLHNTIGFYSSIVIVVMTLSGVLISFGSTTDPLVRRLDFGAPLRLMPESKLAPNGTRITLDAAVAIAESALPGAFASMVSVPDEPKAVVQVLKKFPEDRTPAGRSRVFLDQYSGQVLLVENTREAPLGTRIINLKRSAHTGDIFGAPTRALYFVVSLGIAVQAISGALISWNGRGRP